MAKNRDTEETELSRPCTSPVDMPPHGATAFKNASTVSYDINYTLTVQPKTACKYEWSIGKEWGRGAVTSV